MIQRAILQELLKELHHPEILILLGARQVGKTTLMRELQAHLEKEGRKTAFFDLEQPQVLAEFNQSNANLVEKLKNAGEFVFVDEFQYLENASKIFKAVYDSRVPLKLIASGSSSLEIHKHLSESLAGRRLLVRIFPLQYTEIRNRSKAFSLEHYLLYGGMPGIVSISSGDRKQKMLTELLSAYILKDVKSLVKEENIRAFNHLLYLLAQNQGSLLSVHSLAGEVSLSSKAVGRYLDILEETFVNFRIHSYSNNLGNELRKSCKSYLYDLGIRNAILRDFGKLAERTDKGVLLETFVFLKLQSDLAPNMELKFWRTKEGDEVDFILLKNRKPVPIEVKSQIKNPEIPKGLQRFLLRYPATRSAYVVNENLRAESVLGSTTVRFIKPEDLDTPLQS